MIDKQRADQVAGGVFLIGLAILFMTDVIDFFPGILFVIGASSIARGVAQGRDWYSVPGGLWMIGLGLVFLFNFSWPMLLILVGVSMLLGQSWQSRHQKENENEAKDKPKREEAPYIVDESESGPETTVEDLIDNRDI